MQKEAVITEKAILFSQYSTENNLNGSYFFSRYTISLWRQHKFAIMSGACACIYLIFFPYWAPVPQK